MTDSPTEHSRRTQIETLRLAALRLTRPDMRGWLWVAGIVAAIVLGGMVLSAIVGGIAGLFAGGPILAPLGTAIGIAGAVWLTWILGKFVAKKTSPFISHLADSQEEIEIKKGKRPAPVAPSVTGAVLGQQ